MDMIFEGQVTQPKKTPTLLKWLESEDSVKLKQKYWVKKIWIPNKFPTLTFETEDFRLPIDESNPIFTGLMKLVEEIVDSDQAIAVVVSPDRDGGFGITTDGSQGKWEQFTSTGYEFKMSQKQTVSRKHRTRV